MSNYKKYLLKIFYYLFNSSYSKLFEQRRSCGASNELNNENKNFESNYGKSTRRFQIMRPYMDLS